MDWMGKVSRIQAKDFKKKQKSTVRKAIIYNMLTCCIIILLFLLLRPCLPNVFAARRKQFLTFRATDDDEMAWWKRMFSTEEVSSRSVDYHIMLSLWKHLIVFFGFSSCLSFMFVPMDAYLLEERISDVTDPLVPIRHGAEEKVRLEEWLAIHCLIPMPVNMTKNAISPHHKYQIPEAVDSNGKPIKDQKVDSK